MDAIHTLSVLVAIVAGTVAVFAAISGSAARVEILLLQLRIQAMVVELLRLHTWFIHHDICPHASLHCMKDWAATDDADTVVRVEFQALGENRGLAADMRRLVLHFASGRTASFVVKSPRAPPVPAGANAFWTRVHQRCSKLVSGQWREALFYVHAAAPAVPVVPRQKYHLPRCAHACANSWTGEYVLVMEEVTNATGVNMFLGNQIWGVPSLPRPRGPETVLVDVFHTAADIHAAHWRDPALRRSRWLKAAAWYRGEQRAQWELGVRTAARAWDGAMHKRRVHGSPQSQLRLDAALERLVEASLRHASWSALQQHLHDPGVPFTLTHGDMHASNMLWRYTRAEAQGAADSDGELVLVDWSEVAVWEPAADLGQMLISDVLPPLRRALEERLLQAYHARLCAGGVSDYAFTQLLADYKRAPLERWLWLLCYLLNLDLPAHALQYFHDQTAAFMHDHGWVHAAHMVMKPIVVVM